MNHTRGFQYLSQLATRGFQQSASRLSIHATFRAHAFLRAKKYPPPIHHPRIAPIRERRVLLFVLSAGISAVYTGFYFAVALAAGFPVPFSYLTLNIVWISLIVAGMWVYMGPESRTNALIRQRLKFHAMFIYAASSLAVVYPLFCYAFLCAREYTSAQFLLTVALPIIKMMEKLLLYHTTRHASDIQPVLITFNVEVFNAVFVSSCIRNATSISVTTALMVADFMGACTALYGLRNVLLHIDVKMGAGSTRAQMVEVAVAIASRHHPDTLVIPQHDEHVLRSGRTVTPWDAGASTRVVDNMNSNRTGNDRILDDASMIDPPQSPSKIAWGKKTMSSKLSAVVPAETNSPSALHRRPSVEGMDNDAVLVQMLEGLTLKERQQFVHETCRVLRRVEFHLLTEYTEVMVPFIYVIYIATVYYLPIRKFFPYLNEMSEADLVSTVRSVLLYGSLQLLSFITLLVVLTRRFQLAPGAILRFVLLYEWRVVQGHFVLWIVYVLQLSIQHVGTDYTFKFKWLHE